MGSDRLWLLRTLYVQQTPCTGHTMIKVFADMPSWPPACSSSAELLPRGVCFSLPTGRGRSALLLLGRIPHERRGGRNRES